MIICILDCLFDSSDSHDTMDNDRPSGIATISSSMTELNSSQKDLSRYTGVRYYKNIHDLIEKAQDGIYYDEEYYIELGLSVNPNYDISPTLEKLVKAIEGIEYIHILFSSGWDMYSSKIFQGPALYFNRTAELQKQLQHISNERLHFWLGNTTEVTDHKRMFPGADVQYYSVYPTRMAVKHVRADMPFYKPPGSDTVRDKTFLCLNNYEKEHRTHMVRFFKDHTDLSAEAHVSYLKPDDPTLHITVDGGKDQTEIGEWQDIVDYKIIDDCYTYVVTETHFKSELPLLWNNQQYPNILWPDGVPEHGMPEYEMPLSGWVSEKSLKSAYYQLPLIVVGYPGSLDAFKKLGFKTFPEFFDEEYDTVGNFGLRLKLIQDNIERLASMNKGELHNLYHSESVQEKLQYNKNHLISMIQEDPYMNLFRRIDIHKSIQDFLNT
jgi:hypothetical protein